MADPRSFLTPRPSDESDPDLRGLPAGYVVVNAEEFRSLKKSIQHLTESVEGLKSQISNDKHSRDMEELRKSYETKAKETALQGQIAELTERLDGHQEIIDEGKKGLKAVAMVVLEKTAGVLLPVLMALVASYWANEKLKERDAQANPKPPAVVPALPAPPASHTP